MVKNRLILSALGLGAILCGLALYAFLREFPPALISKIHVGRAVDSIWVNSLPSFFHVLGFSLFSIACLNWKRPGIWLVPWFWFVFALVLEGLQSVTLPVLSAYFLGTFDVWDVIFSFAAALLASSTILFLTPPSHAMDRRLQTILMFSIVVMGFLSSVASTHEVCVESQGTTACGANATPIYMSYEALRSAVVTDDTRRVGQYGKVYTYNNLLLVSERGEGIHIWDNSNPNTPTRINFIAVPGNEDMAVKNGFLYADSFVDLVVIDLNNLNQIQEVKRIENAFPYNSHQVVPQSIRLRDVDETKGVVIGYVPDAN